MLAHLASFDWGRSGHTHVNSSVDLPDLQKAVLLRREHGGEVQVGKLNHGFLGYHHKRSFLFWDLSFTHPCRPKKKYWGRAGRGKMSDIFSYRLCVCMVESQGSITLFPVRSRSCKSESFQARRCVPAAFGSLANPCAAGSSRTTALCHFVEGVGAGKSVVLVCMPLSPELGTDLLYCYR